MGCYWLGLIHNKSSRKVLDLLQEILKFFSESIVRIITQLTFRNSSDYVNHSLSYAYLFVEFLELATIRFVPHHSAPLS